MRFIRYPVLNSNTQVSIFVTVFLPQPHLKHEVLDCRYRAILGPFQWGVWVCVIFIYLVGVVPIVFSYRLRCNMFESFAELGTFFWMVFGTFTNLFTFRGENTWNNIKNSSTRSVIGNFFFLIFESVQSGITEIYTVFTFERNLLGFYNHYYVSVF